MAIVTFWGPNVNQNGSTAIAASVASNVALDLSKGYSSLLVTTNYKDDTLESAFKDIEKLTSRSTIDFTDVGLDALDRLIKSGKLSIENLKDYTTPILKGSLDLMFGTQKKEKELYHKLMDIMPNILECAEASYDITFVDVQNGDPDVYVKKVLEMSDLIVVNISQSMALLKDFFFNIVNSDILREKKYVLVIGKYDRHSKYHAKNISKFFKLKQKIFTVPYNTQFFDMQNEHKTLEFFIKYMNEKPEERNGFFINETKKLSEHILENIVVSANK